MVYADSGFSPTECHVLISLCNDVMMCNNNNISRDSEYHMVSEDSLLRPMCFV